MKESKIVPSKEEGLEEKPKKRKENRKARTSELINCIEKRIPKEGEIPLEPSEEILTPVEENKKTAGLKNRTPLEEMTNECPKLAWKCTKPLD